MVISLEVPEGRHIVAHHGSSGKAFTQWKESPGRGGTHGAPKWNYLLRTHPASCELSARAVKFPFISGADEPTCLPLDRNAREVRSIQSLSKKPGQSLRADKLPKRRMPSPLHRISASAGSL